MANAATAARWTTGSFNIPKIKKSSYKDNLQQMSLNNRDVQNLLRDIHKNCLDINFSKEIDVLEVYLVHNADVLSQYIDKKAEMKDAGRSIQTLHDQLGFRFIHPKDKCTIAKEGLYTKPVRFNRLGKGECGVYLTRFFDVEVKTAWQDEIVNIFVFKYVSGKCKSLKVGNINSTSSSMEPTPNYDSHIDSRLPQLSDSLFVQVARSSIYLYEYTEECLPSKHPRHILPFAIITLRMRKQLDESVQWANIPRDVLSKSAVSENVISQKECGKSDSSNSKPTEACRPAASSSQSSSKTSSQLRIENVTEDPILTQNRQLASRSQKVSQRTEAANTQENQKVDLSEASNKSHLIPKGKLDTELSRDITVDKKAKLPVTKVALVELKNEYMKRVAAAKEKVHVDENLKMSECLKFLPPAEPQSMVLQKNSLSCLTKISGLTVQETDFQISKSSSVSDVHNAESHISRTSSETNMNHVHIPHTNPRFKTNPKQLNSESPSNFDSRRFNLLNSRTALKCVPSKGGSAVTAGQSYSPKLAKHISDLPSHKTDPRILKRSHYVSTDNPPASNTISRHNAASFSFTDIIKTGTAHLSSTQRAIDSQKTMKRKMSYSEYKNRRIIKTSSDSVSNASSNMAGVLKKQLNTQFTHYPEHVTVSTKDQQQNVISMCKQSLGNVQLPVCGSNRIEDTKFNSDAQCVASVTLSEKDKVLYLQRSVDDKLSNVPSSACEEVRRESDLHVIDDYIIHSTTTSPEDLQGRQLRERGTCGSLISTSILEVGCVVTVDQIEPKDSTSVLMQGQSEEKPLPSQKLIHDHCTEAYGNNHSEAAMADTVKIGNLKPDVHHASFGESVSVSKSHLHYPAESSDLKALRFHPICDANESLNRVTSIITDVDALKTSQPTPSMNRSKILKPRLFKHDIVVLPTKGQALQSPEDMWAAFLAEVERELKEQVNYRRKICSSALAIQQGNLNAEKPLPKSISMKDLGIGCYILALDDKEYQPLAIVVDYKQVKHKKECNICNASIQNMALIKKDMTQRKSLKGTKNQTSVMASQINNIADTMSKVSDVSSITSNIPSVKDLPGTLLFKKHLPNVTDSSNCGCLTQVDECKENICNNVFTLSTETTLTCAPDASTEPELAQVMSSAPISKSSKDDSSTDFDSKCSASQYNKADKSLTQTSLLLNVASSVAHEKVPCNNYGGMAQESILTCSENIDSTAEEKLCDSVLLVTENAKNIKHPLIVPAKSTKMITKTSNKTCIAHSGSGLDTSDEESFREHLLEKTYRLKQATDGRAIKNHCMAKIARRLEIVKEYIANQKDTMEIIQQTSNQDSIIHACSGKESNFNISDRREHIVEQKCRLKHATERRSIQNHCKENIDDRPERVQESTTNQRNIELEKVRDSRTSISGNIRHRRKRQSDNKSDDKCKRSKSSPVPNINSSRRMSHSNLRMMTSKSSKSAPSNRCSVTWTEQTGGMFAFQMVRAETRKRGNTLLVEKTNSNLEESNYFVNEKKHSQWSRKGLQTDDENVLFSASLSKDAAQLTSLPGQDLVTGPELDVHPKYTLQQTSLSGKDLEGEPKLDIYIKYSSLQTSLSGQDLVAGFDIHPQHTSQQISRSETDSEAGPELQGVYPNNSSQQTSLSETDSVGGPELEDVHLQHSSQQTSLSEADLVTAPELEDTHPQHTSLSKADFVIGPELKDAHTQHTSLSEADLVTGPELEDAHPQHTSLSKAHLVTGPELEDAHPQHTSLSKADLVTGPELEDAHPQHTSLSKADLVTRPELEDAHPQHTSLSKADLVTGPELKDTHSQQTFLSEINSVAGSQLEDVYTKHSSMQTSLPGQCLIEGHKLNLQQIYSFQSCCSSSSLIVPNPVSSSVSCEHILPSSTDMTQLTNGNLVSNMQLVHHLSTQEQQIEEMDDNILLSDVAEAVQMSNFTSYAQDEEDLSALSVNMQVDLQMNSAEAPANVQEIKTHNQSKPDDGFFFVKLFLDKVRGSSEEKRDIDQEFLAFQAEIDCLNAESEHISKSETLAEGAMTLQDNMMQCLKNASNLSSTNACNKTIESPLYRNSNSNSIVIQNNDKVFNTHNKPARITMTNSRENVNMFVKQTYDTPVHAQDNIEQYFTLNAGAVVETDSQIVLKSQEAVPLCGLNAPSISANMNDQTFIPSLQNTLPFASFSNNVAQQPDLAWTFENKNSYVQPYGNVNLRAEVSSPQRPSMSNHSWDCLPMPAHSLYHSSQQYITQNQFPDHSVLWTLQGPQNCSPPVTYHFHSNLQHQHFKQQSSLKAPTLDTPVPVTYFPKTPISKASDDNDCRHSESFSVDSCENTTSVQRHRWSTFKNRAFITCSDTVEMEKECDSIYKSPSSSFWTSSANCNVGNISGLRFVPSDTSISSIPGLLDVNTGPNDVEQYGQKPSQSTITLAAEACLITAAGVKADKETQMTSTFDPKTIWPEMYDSSHITQIASHEEKCKSILKSLTGSSSKETTDAEIKADQIIEDNHRDVCQRGIALQVSVPKQSITDLTDLLVTGHSVNLHQSTAALSRSSKPQDELEVKESSELTDLLFKQLSNTIKKAGFAPKMDCGTNNSPKVLTLQKEIITKKTSETSSKLTANSEPKRQLESVLPVTDKMCRPCTITSEEIDINKSSKLCGSQEDAQVGADSLAASYSTTVGTDIGMRNILYSSSPLKINLNDVDVPKSKIPEQRHITASSRCQSKERNGIRTFAVNRPSATASSKKHIKSHRKPSDGSYKFMSRFETPVSGHMYRGSISSRSESLERNGQNLDSYHCFNDTFSRSSKLLVHTGKRRFLDDRSTSSDQSCYLSKVKSWSSSTDKKTQNPRKQMKQSNSPKKYESSLGTTINDKETLLVSSCHTADSNKMPLSSAKVSASSDGKIYLSDVPLSALSLARELILRDIQKLSENDSEDFSTKTQIPDSCKPSTKRTINGSSRHEHGSFKQHNNYSLAADSIEVQDGEETSSNYLSHLISVDSEVTLNENDPSDDIKKRKLMSSMKKVAENNRYINSTVEIEIGSLTKSTERKTDKSFESKQLNSVGSSKCQKASFEKVMDCVDHIQHADTFISANIHKPEEMICVNIGDDVGRSVYWGKQNKNILCKKSKRKVVDDLSTKISTLNESGTQRIPTSVTHLSTESGVRSSKVVNQKVTEIVLKTSTLEIERNCASNGKVASNFTPDKDNIKGTKPKHFTTNDYAGGQTSIRKSSLTNNQNTVSQTTSTQEVLEKHSQGHLEATEHQSHSLSDRSTTVQIFNDKKTLLLDKESTDALSKTSTLSGNEALLGIRNPSKIFEMSKSGELTSEACEINSDAGAVYLDISQRNSLLLLVNDTLNLCETDKTTSETTSYSSLAADCSSTGDGKSSAMLEVYEKCEKSPQNVLNLVQSSKNKNFLKCKGKKMETIIVNTVPQDKDLLLKCNETRTRVKTHVQKLLRMTKLEPQIETTVTSYINTEGECRKIDKPVAICEKIEEHIKKEIEENKINLHALKTVNKLEVFYRPRIENRKNTTERFKHSTMETEWDTSSTMEKECDKSTFYPEEYTQKKNMSPHSGETKRRHSDSRDSDSSTYSKTRRRSYDSSSSSEKFNSRRQRKSQCLSPLSVDSRFSGDSRSQHRSRNCRRSSSSSSYYSSDYRKRCSRSSSSPNFRRQSQSTRYTSRKRRRYKPRQRYISPSRSRYDSSTCDDHNKYWPKSVHRNETFISQKCACPELDYYSSTAKNDRRCTDLSHISSRTQHTIDMFYNVMNMGVQKHTSGTGKTCKDAQIMKTSKTAFDTEQLKGGPKENETNTALARDGLMLCQNQSALSVPAHVRHNRTHNVTVKELIVSQFGISITKDIEHSLPYSLNSVLSSLEFLEHDRQNRPVETLLCCLKHLNIPVFFSNIEPGINPPFEERLEYFSDEQILLEVNVIKQCLITLEHQQKREAVSSSLSLLDTTNRHEQLQLRKITLLDEINHAKFMETLNPDSVSAEMLSRIESDLFAVIQEENNFPVNVGTYKEKTFYATKLTDFQDIAPRTFSGEVLPKELQVPVYDFNFSVPKQAMPQKKALDLRESLDIAIQNILELYKCFDFGRKHFRIPELLLLAEEKYQLYSRGHYFLILKKSIPKKVFIQLLTIKNKIETSNKDTEKSVEEKYISNRHLIDERESLLQNYIGKVTYEECFKVRTLYNQMMDCLEFIRSVIGSKDLKRLAVFDTYLRAVKYHYKILNNEFKTQEHLSVFCILKLPSMKSKYVCDMCLNFLSITPSHTLAQAKAYKLK